MKSSDLVPSDPNADSSGQDTRNDSGDAGGTKAKAGTHGQTQRPQYPDRETCLANIARLVGLLALNLITPAQANSMRGLYGEILRSLDAAKQSASAPIDDEELLRGFRDQPELFKLIEPFLTDAQVALILKEVGNDEPG